MRAAASLGAGCGAARALLVGIDRELVPFELAYSWQLTSKSSATRLLLLSIPYANIGSISSTLPHKHTHSVLGQSRPFLVPSQQMTIIKHVFFSQLIRP